MGYYTTAEIVKIVNKLIDRCGTRDPYKVAKELGINVIYRNFDKQRGAYKDRGQRNINLFPRHTCQAAHVPHDDVFHLVAV